MTDKLHGPEYDSECKKLIHQYQMCISGIPNFHGLDHFIKVSDPFEVTNESRNTTSFSARVLSEEYRKARAATKEKTSIRTW